MARAAYFAVTVSNISKIILELIAGGSAISIKAY
jgi:hypothetical protein